MDNFPDRLRRTNGQTWVSSRRREQKDPIQYERQSQRLEPVPFPLRRIKRVGTANSPNGRYGNAKDPQTIAPSQRAIFTFHTGEPIRFAFHENVTNRDRVVRAIQANGGVVSAELEPVNYFILPSSSSNPQILSYVSSNGSVPLDVAWIWESLYTGRIVPWYGYLIASFSSRDEESETKETDEERDLVELSVALARYLPVVKDQDVIYEFLATKLPHSTPAEFQALHLQHKQKVDIAVKDLVRQLSIVRPQSGFFKPRKMIQGPESGNDRMRVTEEHASDSYERMESEDISPFEHKLNQLHLECTGPPRLQEHAQPRSMSRLPYAPSSSSTPLFLSKSRETQIQGNINTEAHGLIGSTGSAESPNVNFIACKSLQTRELLVQEQVMDMEIHPASSPKFKPQPLQRQRQYSSPKNSCSPPPPSPHDQGISASPLSGMVRQFSRKSKEAANAVENPPETQLVNAQTQFQQGKLPESHSVPFIPPVNMKNDVIQRHTTRADGSERDIPGIHAKPRSNAAFSAVHPTMSAINHKQNGMDVEINGLTTVEPPISRRDAPTSNGNGSFIPLSNLHPHIPWGTYSYMEEVPPHPCLSGVLYGQDMRHSQPAKDGAQEPQPSNNNLPPIVGKQPYSTSITLAGATAGRKPYDHVRTGKKGVGNARNGSSYWKRGSSTVSTKINPNVDVSMLSSDEDEEVNEAASVVYSDVRNAGTIAEAPVSMEEQRTEDAAKMRDPSHPQLALVGPMDFVSSANNIIGIGGHAESSIETELRAINNHPRRIGHNKGKKWSIVDLVSEEMEETDEDEDGDYASSKVPETVSPGDNADHKSRRRKGGKKPHVTQEELNYMKQWMREHDRNVSQKEFWSHFALNSEIGHKRSANAWCQTWTRYLRPKGYMLEDQRGKWLPSRKRKIRKRPIGQNTLSCTRITDKAKDGVSPDNKLTGKSQADFVRKQQTASEIELGNDETDIQAMVKYLVDHPMEESQSLEDFWNKFRETYDGLNPKDAHGWTVFYGMRRISIDAAVEARRTRLLKEALAEDSDPVNSISRDESMVSKERVDFASVGAGSDIQLESGVTNTSSCHSPFGTSPTSPIPDSVPAPKLTPEAFCDLSPAYPLEVQEHLMKSLDVYEKIGIFDDAQARHLKQCAMTPNLEMGSWAVWDKFVRLNAPLGHDASFWMERYKSRKHDIEESLARLESNPSEATFASISSKTMPIAQFLGIKSEGRASAVYGTRSDIVSDKSFPSTRNADQTANSVESPSPMKATSGTRPRKVILTVKTPPPPSNLMRHEDPSLSQPLR